MSANSFQLPRNIAVLLGGTSAEREVSLQSGATIAEALSRLGAEVVRVDPAEPGWLAQLSDLDFVFNALHGPGGEDGGVQGAMELVGVPYSGSGVLGSALALDKKRSKQLWQGIGLPTAGFAQLHDDTDWDAVIERYGKVFVKAAREGSSIGMRPADSAQSLHEAYEFARDFAGCVIAEQFIDGPEYTVAILGDRALPSISMTTDNEFYDYEAKYLSDETAYNCPSGLTAAEETELADIALQAFASLDCAVWGRVDLMRDGSGRFYLLEINTIPGMTSHSLVPMAARESGLEIEQLVSEVVRLSLLKGKDDAC